MKKLLFAIIAAFFLATPVVIYAQEDTSTYELPVEPDSAAEENEADSTVTETTAEPTDIAQWQREDFLTGLAAGAAIGVVAGGVVIWFLKK